MSSDLNVEFAYMNPEVELAFNPVHQVAQQHARFSVPVGGSERREFRATLIREEFEETMEALEAGTRAEVLKECADLAIVAIGTLIEMCGEEGALVVMRRVHVSNLSKLGADGRPVLREDGKYLKGPNYKPPDLEDL